MSERGRCEDTCWGESEMPNKDWGARWGGAALAQSADLSQEIKAYDLVSVMAHNISEMLCPRIQLSQNSTVVLVW